MTKYVRTFKLPDRQAHIYKDTDRWFKKYYVALIEVKSATKAVAILNDSTDEACVAVNQLLPITPTLNSNKEHVWIVPNYDQRLMNPYMRGEQYIVRRIKETGYDLHTSKQ